MQLTERLAGQTLAGCSHFSPIAPEAPSLCGPARVGARLVPEGTLPAASAARAVLSALQRPLDFSALLEGQNKTRSPSRQTLLTPLPS